MVNFRWGLSVLRFRYIPYRVAKKCQIIKLKIRSWAQKMVDFSVLNWPNFIESTKSMYIK